MDILLINPNQYRTPPVPPIGLESLTGALDHAGYRWRILDLCFEDDSHAAIDRAIAGERPSLVGFTIRNIDTVIYDNNEFFLDSIAGLVRHVKTADIPVILGGAGFSFAPQELLRYLDGDWGIAGPGERALAQFMSGFDQDKPPVGTIIDGFAVGIDPTLPAPRGCAIDYVRYGENRAIAGFETQKGCTESCSYCLECRRRTLLFRDPHAVVAEIRELAGRGITRFHLCDTEFNQNLDHCKTFLKTLIDEGPSIEWALYLKSGPVDEDLFRLLAASGANLVTLSLPTGDNWLTGADEQIRLAREHGIKLAIDLLVGFPGQTADDVRRIFDTLRSYGPATVGVNSTFRLFPGLPVTGEIMSSMEHRAYLLGVVDDNPDLIKPVFYRWLTVDMLSDIIDGDPLFKIEGFEKTSNYERV